ncbi:MULTISPECIES: UvrB/UvrC motif-containing protein [unclassified Planococcus (in: firmicutes)]|uniref:UvrB/UvrC motif-containing protein n=1 Tax=Planococcus TaxID=1372 RepID=UPI000C31B9A3|nr:MULTISPECIES: UvrB/UvrC motif-containing protein [unclassified Planococcus (in: firmicutes)]AUD12580.1 nucleotide excision repair protein [Planococcus sp. MB-3u-03]PKG44584.1 nucleotide excision repair protein [Planococcus sp. Urea-trap-24]PKG91333.1 nucleotide excision repair protein [Planococcus sp. Urea-3u-39]PKH35955.1 nucleotide excision repair protein [Planococcus sp. MB-3u-09]
MICEQCGERPATVIVKQNQQDHLTERHLCHVCAAENHNISFSFDQDPMAIHNLLANWFPKQQAAVSPVRKEVPACPSCGFTFQKFLSLGKFGCAECYSTFAPQLDEILKRVQNGNTEHAGKIPASYGTTLKIKKEIEELRKQMQAAIQDENFEEAARLRDQVKALNEKLEGGGDVGD